MWVDSVAVSNGEHIASLDGSVVTSAGDGDGGCTFRRHGGGGGAASSGTRTNGERLDRLAHVHFFVTQNLFTHHAVLELARDDILRVEETRQTVDQSSVSSRVDGSVTGRHGCSIFVQLLLGLQQNQSGARGGTRGADAVTDGLESVSHVSIHGRCQLADTRLQDTLCEVVQLHRQFGSREVDADMLLRCHGQGGVLLVVVLNLQSGTVSHQSAVGQADTQSGANLGTFYGERIVIFDVQVGSLNQPRFRSLRFHVRTDYIFKQVSRFDLTGSLISMMPTHRT